MIVAEGSSAPNVVHLCDIAPRPKIFTRWERTRNGKAHWFTECVAEFIGVWFYCYAGVGATAPFVLQNVLGVSTLGSLLGIGISYGCGIVFAITICAATSGGHFNPGITIALVVYKGFPPLKGLRYIVAQILGGYVACLLVYCQYKNLIDQADAAMAAAGVLEATQFTPHGTGGILGLYLNHGSNLGQVFLNEFVTDFMLTLVIWGSIDPTNHLIPPPFAPFIIALGYATAVWGFAVPGLATNAARDLGGRFAALTIYGSKASGGSYAAIAALTNIPAILFGVGVYEVFLADSQRVVPNAHLEYMKAAKGRGCLHDHAPNEQYAQPAASAEKVGVRLTESV